jgi:heavy metal sensor kinase
VIDVHIAQSRRKIDDPFPIKLLHTVRGVGFVLRGIKESLLRIRPTYIRTRLTLWYIAIFSLIMGLYVSAACAIQYWELNEQLYHAEVQDMETVEGLLYFTPDGQLLLHEEYHSHPRSSLLLDRLMEVFAPNGAVLFRNEKLNKFALGGPPLPQESSVSHFATRMRLADGTHVLVVSHFHPVQGKRVLIRLAYSTELLRRRLIELLVVLMLVSPLALIAAGFAGYRVAGKALKPLADMAYLTQQITTSRLSSRVSVENPNDEFGCMARVLNGLLERIEEAFQKLQRFTSDISHELRTPLTSMRSVGEVGLQQSHSDAEYQDIIGSMLEEVGRLTSMIDSLLTIAHADSGSIQLNRTVFPIMELVEESLGVVGVLAEEKKQTLFVVGNSALSVSADRGFLRMAVINLLDNAVKYSPIGSAIHIVLEPSTDERYIKLTFADEGPGVPISEANRVFDRFYRLDEGRTREEGGAGLGLAIAKWSVEAHGGEIILDSEPGRGAAFTIRLPVV